jgi:hypothetical protein
MEGPETFFITNFPEIFEHPENFREFELIRALGNFPQVEWEGVKRKYMDLAARAGIPTTGRAVGELYDRWWKANQPAPTQRGFAIIMAEKLKKYGTSNPRKRKLP